jgi:CheY-like chemotaxis protein
MGNHRGRRILIVEDEALIALHIQSVLEALGWVVVDVAMTQARALALIEGDQPNFDAVTLDLNLGGQIAIDVAEALDAREIPFVITTGYDDAAYLGPFAGRLIVQKPILDAELAQALDSLKLSPSDRRARRSD